MANTLRPSLYEYAMACACPLCPAAAGVECAKATLAPGPAFRRGAEKGIILVPDPLHRLHLLRQLLGESHYQRDVASAPWPDEQAPGDAS